MKGTELTVLLIALTQGLLDLINLPIFYFYKDILHINPAAMSLYYGLALAPWIFKPLFGFLSDVYPLMGSKRKSYLVVASVLESIAILYMAKFAKTALELMTCHFLQVTCLVLRNVIGGTSLLIL